MKYDVRRLLAFATQFEVDISPIRLLSTSHIRSTVCRIVTHSKMSATIPRSLEIDADEKKPLPCQKPRDELIACVLRSDWCVFCSCMGVECAESTGGEVKNEWTDRYSRKEMGQTASDSYCCIDIAGRRCSRCGSRAERLKRRAKSWKDAGASRWVRPARDS